MDNLPFTYQQGALVVLGILLATAFHLFFVYPRVQRRGDTRVRAAKDQFIGLASHYLLTPITIIQTATSRLQEADTNISFEERQRLYDAITMGQQRLWIIAEQLVLINEIEHNVLQLRIDVHDLPEVVTGAMAAVDVFARSKKVRLEFDDKTLEVKQIRIDNRRLKQALIAILDNAIKFSVEETVIHVRLSMQNSIFSIEIEDEGIGMPEEILQHLGEKFYRGSGIYNFDYEGLGLGLHIAHSIVRSHQGDVIFQSRPKRGTIVTVELPT